MRRSYRILVFTALAVAGVAAGAFVSGIGASPVRSDATIRITVKASEFKFVLSKQSVPVGTTVIFNVVNKGKITHDFKISGKKTAILAPGKSANLTVRFAKKGQVPFICTLPGHAPAGMKGKLAVGTAPIKTPTTTTTPPATTTTPATTPPPSSGSEPLQGDPAAGAPLFKSLGCGGCHTLGAAGTTGTVGPNLDLLKPGQARIRAVVQGGSSSGGATMPAFDVSGANLNNLVAYVYASTH